MTVHETFFRHNRERGDSFSGPLDASGGTILRCVWCFVEGLEDTRAEFVVDGNTMCEHHLRRHVGSERD